MYDDTPRVVSVGKTLFVGKPLLLYSTLILNAFFSGGLRLVLTDVHFFTRSPALSCYILLYPHLDSVLRRNNLQFEFSSAKVLHINPSGPSVTRLSAPTLRLAAPKGDRLARVRSRQDTVLSLA